MNLQPLIDSRLAMASTIRLEHPEAVIVVGPIASGKTTVRKKHFATGYVHIDSADIFHELSNGDPNLNFPAAFAYEIDYVGREITRQALDLGLSIVLETTGHDSDEMISLVNALRLVGYLPEIVALATDRETCERQDAQRGDNVSSYWAAPIHLGWVVSECAGRTAA